MAAFERLRVEKLRLKPLKCPFLQREAHILAYVASAKGIHADSEKTRAVHEWHRPTKSFLVSSDWPLTMAGSFIAHFVAKAERLHGVSPKRRRTSCGLRSKRVLSMNRGSIWCNLLALYTMTAALRAARSFLTPTRVLGTALELFCSTSKPMGRSR